DNLKSLNHAYHDECQTNRSNLRQYNIAKNMKAIGSIYERCFKLFTRCSFKCSKKNDEHEGCPLPDISHNHRHSCTPCCLQPRKSAHSSEEWCKWSEMGIGHHTEEKGYTHWCYHHWQEKNNA